MGDDGAWERVPTVIVWHVEAGGLCVRRDPSGDVQQSLDRKRQFESRLCAHVYIAGKRRSSSGDLNSNVDYCIIVVLFQKEG